LDETERSQDARTNKVIPGEDFPAGKVEFHSNNLRGLGWQFAFKGDARNVALAKVFRLHLVAVGIWCCLPLGGGAPCWP